MNRQDFGNKLLFGLRSQFSLKLRPDRYRERGGQDFLQSEFPKELAASLSENSLRLNLAYRDLLRKVDWRPETHAGQILDLGSKNFFYCVALSNALQGLGWSGTLTGLEIDAYRRYANYHRRIDYANYYVGLANAFFPRIKVAYEPGDWLRLDAHNSYDLVFCFFPFLFTELHLGWGLPLSTYEPKEFYRKIFQYSSRALFAHQGRDELQESLGYLSILGVQAKHIVRLGRSTMALMDREVYLVSAQRPKLSTRPRTES